MTSDDFKQLPIWQRMTANSGAEEIAMVERHVDYILPLMEYYVDTFPTYTLHNRQHIYNVICLMGKVLGDQVEKLTGLEAIILILSAAYHDFGMVFSKEERKAINEYDDFNRKFLSELPGARVQYEENNRIVSKDLAEWYCRWAHAKRVWPKLDEVGKKQAPLQWNGMPFRQQIGFVCESHNEPTENIRIDDERFKTDFLGICDLRFCALLLRLADILDFDNTRSPQSVYDYLDLGNPKNRAEEISKDEWNKHMVSRGFQFPDKPERHPIIFKAAPPHPYIEEGIRNFLDLIDIELRAAEKVSHFCSARWQRFPFPESIDRSNIISNNYKSGKYRFSLSEDKILDLLTGEDLYKDDFIFIRELLQNAIDTVRHRTYIEKIHKEDYQPTEIQVSFFKDDEGYYWLRVDDQGMGMNEEIIQSHLLKKGNSYYYSDRFKLEKIKIREEAGRDFVPISRFGIGLLSCFMTCDKIEINTCYFYPTIDHKLIRSRLSIEGRGGYWVYRSESAQHQADKMPSVNGWEKGYRPQPGTSIACRIKTSREFHGLNMEEQIDRFLLATEIPVVFHGKSLGGDRNELANQPWCKSSSTELPADYIKHCSDLLNLEIERIAIDVRSIDLTRNAATENLAGQVALVIPRIKFNNVGTYFNAGTHFRLSSDEKQSFIICQKSERDKNGNETRKEVKYDISEIVDSIRVPSKFLDSNFDYHKFIWPRISHNGIIVYDNGQFLQIALRKFDQFDDIHRDHSFYLSTGLYCFKDALLPEVTVSRNVVKRFTEEIVAHVMYATRELNEFAGSAQYLFGHLAKFDQHYGNYLHFTIKKIENSGLYQHGKDYWQELPCLSLRDKGVCTIKDALLLAKEIGRIEFRTFFFNSGFYNAFAQYMVMKNFKVSYIHDEKDEYYLEGVLTGDEVAIETELLPFRPMKFLDFADEEKIVLKNRSLNKRHPLAKWFLSNHGLIEKEFSYFGIQLLNELTNSKTIPQKVASVTEIINRLRELLPNEARPPKEIIISEVSFFEGDLF